MKDSEVIQVELGGLCPDERENTEKMLKENAADITGLLEGGV